MRLTIITEGPFKREQRVEIERKKTGFTAVPLKGIVLVSTEFETIVRIGGTEIEFRPTRDLSRDKKVMYVGHTQ